MKSKWCTAEGRTGLWAFCVSADGLRHVHMVLESDKSIRFTVVKGVYGAAHIEATKANKDQVMSYVEKTGKYKEKGEQVIYTCREGEIRGSRQGRRSDLEIIRDMLEAEFTPREILRTNFAYRRFDKMIRAEYMDRLKERVPPIRDVQVHYLFGPSGSGKSYTYAQLCAEFGEDRIYLVTDFLNGGMDIYEGQGILFLDELKDQLKYAELLKIIDRYKAQMRYKRLSTVI